MPVPRGIAVNAHDTRNCAGRTGQGQKVYVCFNLHHKVVSSLTLLPGVIC